MRKILFFVLVLLSFKSFATGNKGYEIKLNVKGLSSTPLILAYYYGDKQYIKDTFQIDKTGSCIIKADTPLAGGIYLAVFPKLGNRYFEFVVNEQHFELTTDTLDLAGHMVVKNSLENKLFYDDMKYLNEKRKESETYNSELRNATTDKDKEAAKEKMKKLDTEVKAKREEITKTHPTLFYSNILKAMKELDKIPDFPKDANGKIIDSAFQWRFYKNHYWDNFDLQDDRLIRTPIFNNKLVQFYTKTLQQIPDSLIADGDIFLKKMKPNGDLFKYTLVYFLNEMAKSKLMGFDAVYVHLVKNYYAKGFATWVDSTQLYKIVDRGNKLEPLLLGKKARNIILTDTTLKTAHGLYDIKSKYTILCFWDPDCGHCKKEVPKLYDAYNNLKKLKIDVAAFCPATMPIEEIKKWTNFIKENKLDWINVADPYHQNNFRYEWDIQSTPQIFILDENKVIKAKRIGAEQVEDFLRHEVDPSFRPKAPIIMEEDKTEKPH